MINPKIELYVNNKIYSHFRGVDIMLDLEALAHSFFLEARFPHHEEYDIKRGDACYIEIDGERVLTGYIDSRELEINSDNAVGKYQGRSKTADLIDCNAPIIQINRRNALEIAIELCKPFGIDVVWDAQAEPKRISWKIDPYDKVFDVLGMLARDNNLILTTDPFGNVVFTEAKEEHLGTISLGNEILRLIDKDDGSNRYSEYQAMGTNKQYQTYNWREDGTTKLSPGFARTLVKDDGVTRYRPIMVMTDELATKGSTKKRAEYERDRNIAYGRMLDVEIQGWKFNQKLWYVNRTLSIYAPGTDQSPFLITVVNLVLNNDEGLITHLTLSPPEGYSAMMYQEAPRPELTQRRIDWRDKHKTEIYPQKNQ